VLDVFADECGQLSVEDGLVGVVDFGVVVDGLVVRGVVVVVGAELFVVAILVVGFVDVELWVAAIAAPLPTVRASARDANRTVRLGLRIASPCLVRRDTRPWKRYAMSLA
jgi:hypothetical protein